MNGLTETQAKMWELLKSGHPKMLSELALCLWDEQADPAPSVAKHIKRMRAVVNNEGYEVVFRMVQGCPCYVVTKFLVPMPS